MLRTFIVTLGLIVLSDARADEANFVDARGSEVGPAYLTWEVPRPLAPADLFDGRVGLGARGEEDSAALIVPLRANGAGEYRLTLHDLFVHTADEGGRHLAVYVLREPSPRAIISQLLPDRDSRKAIDYTLTVQLDEAAVRDGHATFLLKATTWSRCYLSGMSLAGPRSSDTVTLDGASTATGVNFVPRALPDLREAEWNFGPRGAGIGTGAAHGYVALSLKPAGIGRHRLSIRGIQLPPGVRPGFAVLRVNGRDVVSNLYEGDTFSTDIDVTPEQATAGRVEVRIEPVIREIVYVRGASLEPSGPLTNLLDVGRLDDLVVWPVPSFTDFRPAMRPTDPPPPMELHLDGARNEWINACWIIGNFTKSGDDARDAEFELSDLRNARGDVIGSSIFRISSLQPIRSSQLTDETVWAGLKRGRTVSIPRNESRQMWLTARLPKSTRPGDYTGTLSASWTGGKAGMQMPVTLRVYDFELPERSPLAVCGWINANATDLDSVVLDHYREHYGNVVCIMVDHAEAITGGYDADGNITRPLDLTKFKACLASARRSQMPTLLLPTYNSCLRSLQWLGDDLPPLEVGSPAYENVLSAVLKEIAAACAEAGYGYDDWYIYPFDEYLGPDFVKVGAVIRRADPKIQIYSDKSDDIHEMTAAAAYVDVWTPHTHQITNDPGQQRLAFMRESGRPIWSYQATATRNVPTLNPYRWHGWFAMDRGLDGIGSYKYLGDYHGMIGYADEVGQDPSDAPLIDTLRLMAWTEGIEDHMYLNMLPPASRERQEALRAVLNQSNEPSVYIKWHQTLGEAIEKQKM